MNEKYEYSTLGQICIRMNWGEKKTLRMIREEGFPAVKIGKEYITSEPKIREWIDKKISCQ